MLVDGADPAEEFDDPESMSMPGQAMSPALGTVRGDIGAYGGPLATELPTFGLQRLDLGEQDQHSCPHDLSWRMRSPIPSTPAPRSVSTSNGPNW